MGLSVCRRSRSKRGFGPAGTFTFRRFRAAIKRGSWSYTSLALPLQAFTRTTYVGISLSVALERHKGRETLVRYVYRLNTGRFLEIRTT